MISCATWLGEMRISVPSVSGTPLDLLHWYSRMASTIPLLPCIADIEVDKDAKMPRKGEDGMAHAKGAHWTKGKEGKGGQVYLLEKVMGDTSICGVVTSRGTFLYQEHHGAVSKLRESSNIFCVGFCSFTSASMVLLCSAKSDETAYSCICPTSHSTSCHAPRRAGSLCVRRSAALSA